MVGAAQFALASTAGPLGRWVLALRAEKPARASTGARLGFLAQKLKRQLRSPCQQAAVGWLLTGPLVSHRACMV